MRPDRQRHAWLALALVALSVGVPVACALPWDAEDQPVLSVSDGDPERGRQAIVKYGCGSCHVIPGVTGADGTVGPPLTEFAARDYMAGQLNEPDNVIRWILDPESVRPQTPMPDVGATEEDARDIATYLYTLD